jgi:hypothetical protein
MGTGLMEIKKFEYTPVLGWSASRYDKFLSCKRRYYYDYYGKYDLENLRLTIDKLKRMTSIPLETGNIVHDVIKVFLERLLKSEKPIDKARFLDFTRQKTQKNCRLKTFAEVYYSEISEINADELFDSAKNSLSNFLNSERYSWITKKAISSKNEWLIEPSGYGETRINGMKGYCKVDFLFPVDDKIYITDWKTGKRYEEKHRKQLLGYSSWASYHFNKDPSTIVPIIAYLEPQYDEMQIEFNESDVQAFFKRVEKETTEMYNLCIDLRQNIPKDKKEFPKTTNIRICKYCNYRELCK